MHHWVGIYIYIHLHDKNGWCNIILIYIIYIYIYYLLYIYIAHICTYHELNAWFRAKCRQKHQGSNIPEDIRVRRENMIRTVWDNQRWPSGGFLKQANPLPSLVSQLKIDQQLRWELGALHFRTPPNWGATVFRELHKSHRVLGKSLGLTHHLGSCPWTHGTFRFSVTGITFKMHIYLWQIHLDSSSHHQSPDPKFVKPQPWYSRNPLREKKTCEKTIPSYSFIGKSI